MLGRILEIDQQKITIQLEEDADRVITFCPHLYPYFDHAWATSIYKAQGSSFDHVFVWANAFLYQNLSYVAFTRHKESLQVLGSKEEFQNKQDFINRLSRVSTKHSSLDYVSPEQAHELMKQDERILKPLFEKLSSQLEAIGFVSREAFAHTWKHFLNLHEKFQQELAILNGDDDTGQKTLNPLTKDALESGGQYAMETPTAPLVAETAVVSQDQGLRRKELIQHIYQRLLARQANPSTSLQDKLFSLAERTSVKMDICARLHPEYFTLPQSCCDNLERWMNIRSLYELQHLKAFQDEYMRKIKGYAFGSIPLEEQFRVSCYAEKRALLESKLLVREHNQFQEPPINILQQSVSQQDSFQAFQALQIQEKELSVKWQHQYGLDHQTALSAARIYTHQQLLASGPLSPTHEQTFMQSVLYCRQHATQLHQDMHHQLLSWGMKTAEIHQNTALIERMAEHKLHITIEQNFYQSLQGKSSQTQMHKDAQDRAHKQIQEHYKDAIQKQTQRALEVHREHARGMEM